MSDAKGILVYCEIKEGKLAPISTEGLGIGKQLAGTLGEELAAVIIGNGITVNAQEAITYGADKVYLVDSDSLKDYQADSYLQALEKVLAQISPQIIILPCLVLP